MITEIVFTMFFRLGTIFFNNPAMSNASPGELAGKFFIRPLNILKDVFGFMTFFAIFTNIAKIILEKINPNFTRNIISKLPYGVAVISGTNGKTTTTKIAVELLSSL